MNKNHFEWEKDLIDFVKPVIQEQLEDESAAKDKSLVSPIEHEAEKKAKQFVENLTKTLSKYSEACKQGFNTISKKMENDKDFNIIKKELEQATAWAIEHTPLFYEEDPLSIEEEKRFPISKETLQKFYDVGCDVFTAEEFENAGNVFCFLVFLNPLVSRHWLSYGNCLHRLEKYEQALEVYACATVTDPDNPEPRLFSAEIYFTLDQPEEAYLELQECKKLISENPEAWGELEEVLREVA